MGGSWGGIWEGSGRDPGEGSGRDLGEELGEDSKSTYIHITPDPPPLAAVMLHAFILL